MDKKIVVFSGNLSYSVCKGIIDIDRAMPGLQWLIVLHHPQKTLKQLLRSQQRNLTRNGWRWIPYQFSDIYSRVEAKFSKSSATQSLFSVATLRAQVNVKIHQSTNIHAEATLQLVRDFSPDLGLSLAAPILRRSLFALPKLGTINLHKGKVPDYRGMPPAFWELWKNEQFVGCTVHWVDDKLDTGDVIAQGQVYREKYSTLKGLQLKLDELGVELMHDAVAEIFADNLISIPQPPGGHTYRKPTLAEMSALRRKLIDLTPEAYKRNQLKKLLFWGIFQAWQMGVRHIFSPRVTVLLYHRVSDSARDNLTVGVEQFDRQMALIGKYCQPVSLEKLLDYRAIPKSKKPLVCVTFDDGYLDNYENAFLILQRHGISATFFVSTGIVASDHPFPHDIKRGNEALPVMQWHHIKKMYNNGFLIGSHTVNHIDCAAETEETVWRELIVSQRDLQRELGLTNIFLGYPYGGMQHMNAERLELVKKAGYSACLSAYGGSNVNAVNRFNVLRRGIHWEFSDQAFLVECLGIK